MGDTAEGSWNSRELGGFIRREEARKEANMKTIRLPAGHDWKEFNTHDSTCYGWTCRRCFAEFGVFNEQDDSQQTSFTAGEKPDACPDSEDGEGMGA